MNSYDINTEFKDYGNQYEILQGIQVNNEHLQKINGDFGQTKIVIKAENLKFVYEFRYINDERSFVELRLRNWFNRVLFIAYKGDYIVRDKTGVYILNKEKFENRYSMMEYEEAK